MKSTSTKPWSQVCEIKGPGLLSVVSSLQPNLESDPRSLSNAQLKAAEKLLAQLAENERKHCQETTARWTLFRQELERRP